MADSERNRHYLIEKMISCYLHRPYSDKQLAERLNTDRSNIYKIRTRTLEDMGIPPQPIEGERGKYYLERKNFPVTLRFTPDEALAIYVAGRKLQQQTRIAQESVASALEKLSEKLHKPLAKALVKSADHILSQEQDNRRTAILTILRDCWLEERKVQIDHRKLHGERRTYIVHPYQIEPSVWGDALYLLGYSEYHNKIASFKIARIEAAKPLEKFEALEEFDAHQLLQFAWGIWSADKEPEIVRLKFDAFITPRVKETIWHPSQTIRDLPEDGCIWEAEIAEPKEMLPWVRGWGSNVLVLEPKEMKESLKDSLQRLNKKYELIPQTAVSETRLLQLWGKTTKNPDIFHPALYHMLDVAHVAQQLLSSRTTPRWRYVLGRTLNTDPDSLHEWLPWFIALHDIGKISVPFQAQNAPQKQRLENENFDFGRYTTDHKELHHTIMGRLILKEMEWVKHLPRNLKNAFLEMVSGHHGKYQQPNRRKRQLQATLHESSEWDAMRQQAVRILENCLLLSKPNAWPQPENVSAAIATLNGFTILCDWLGSDETYFKPTPNTPLLDYLSISRQKARERVESAGFFVPAISHAPATFTELFGWQPRPLQTAIDNIPNHQLTEPTLTIIEAPTGEGKTEAALTLARRIAQAQGTDEMYIALPTTATSNAMYKRLQEHLQARLLLPPNLVQLVHGQAFLVQDDLRIKPMDNGDGEPHPALTWFEPKKKSLLAPFGVGTVDQAELAALNVKHNALRLIGLAGKVVILDEVHAYDTYMTTIIARMLEWLSALGTSVVLLSATLPLNKRQLLVEKYSGGKAVLEQTDAYPYLLTVSGTNVYTATPSATNENKQIQLHTLHFAEEDWQGKAEWLRQKADKGGCVCWMANTVERAQHTFQALLEIVPDDVDCTLLHARFPLTARQAIEETVLSKYGRDVANRPLKGIVIGTQVLEQSLDIDFDLMVSDLAPIDLLLQRIGRLHRHDRSDRAPAYAEPHVYINYELDAAGQLRIGKDRFYTPYILLKTWQVIEKKTAVFAPFNLPHDYRPLIEAVYDETTPAKDAPLFKAWQERQIKENKLEGEANLRLSNPPDLDDPFCEDDRKEFKEDEESTDWMVAQTRYQEREAITVIPIERVDEDNGRIPSIPQISLHQPANRETQLMLLQRSIRLSNPEIVKQIKIAPKPKLFTDSALLKRCYPIWIEGETVQDMPLRLDNKLGLLIEKKNPHVGGEME